MVNAVSVLRLQADRIDGEAKILSFAVIVCELHDLPETARALRLSATILRESATIIRREADQLETSSDNQGE